MGTLERRLRERDRRRTKIVDAAEEIFLLRGVQDATMGEVASRAELSKGALYLYFKSKQELALAIGLRRRTRLLDRFDEQILEASSGKDLLQRLFAEYTAFLQERGDLIELSMGFLFAGEKLVAKVLVQFAIV